MSSRSSWMRRFLRGRYVMKSSMNIHFCCSLNFRLINVDGIAVARTFQTLGSVWYVVMPCPKHLRTNPAQSQIKKEFFGALLIRKVQDSQDSSLASQRPATTVHVYDTVKT